MPKFCLLNGPRINTPTAVSTQWFLNNILQFKKPGLLGEMIISRAEAGKIQDELGA